LSEVCDPYPAKIKDKKQTKTCGNKKIATLSPLTIYYNSQTLGYINTEIFPVTIISGSESRGTTMHKGSADARKRVEDPENKD
jgi:hypothetical protein